ncbi:hypothetical protein CBOM_05859 [Ceraceosorus bombacis]|uniref:Uncharacterized protein n=1 Tax=Ceraceosorus bombacis TaxID=401625 RepID=A0A0P1BSL7_9BASI|nr:hypothetical protein CBOM_05859 [Ceraceosorus bombacis]
MQQDPCKHTHTTQHHRKSAEEARAGRRRTWHVRALRVAAQLRPAIDRSIRFDQSTAGPSASSGFCYQQNAWRSRRSS